MRAMVLFGFMIAALFGCAGNEWYKPGWTPESFNRDRYDCLKESQQRVSTSQANVYGVIGSSSSNSQVITNDTLFTSCMQARGWYLRPRSK